jgi:hypothetical protein
MSDLTASVMTLENPSATDTPLTLKSLPDLELPSDECPRRARIQIDLLLLALEALDLGSSEVLLSLSRELDLQGIIKNRVKLWRLRCANPLRRNNQRDGLSLVEAKALVLIACHAARRLTVLIRQLLLAYQQLNAKQLSPEHHFRLSEYLQRFRAHYRARMNPKRPVVATYLASNEKLDALAMQLLEQLLFCTGTSGMQRFWVSLFDGEVA